VIARILQELSRGDWPPPQTGGRLRVLHVVPSMNGGGMERALVRLLKHSTRYPQRQPRIEHGVCIMQGGDSDLVNACRAYGQVWTLSESVAGRWASLGIRQIIRSFNPHVVHARSTGAWCDAALATVGLRRTALALSFHGRVDLNRPGWRRRQLNGWAARQADCVLIVSHEAAVELSEQYALPISKLRTIANGVDTQLFHPAADREEVIATRASIGLAPADYVAVCTANLLPIKAHEVLLRAWATVAASEPAARLVLIGNGPLRSELQELTCRLRLERNVLFLGERADCATLLRAADLFVLASRYEGCSNATLEAMATGLPVVAADVPGMRELMTPNRIGWLAPPDNPAALAETVLAALHDSAARERAGRAGRSAAAGCFGVEAWVRSYTQLYASLNAARAVVPLEGLACAG
jgi:glycosyltransferase involved in cell wall biosynthesis